MSSGSTLEEQRRLSGISSFLVRRGSMQEAQFPSVPSQATAHELASTAGNLEWLAKELKALMGGMDKRRLESAIGSLERELKFLNSLNKKMK